VGVDAVAAANVGADVVAAANVVDVVAAAIVADVVANVVAAVIVADVVAAAIVEADAVVVAIVVVDAAALIAAAGVVALIAAAGVVALIAAAGVVASTAAADEVVIVDAEDAEAPLAVVLLSVAEVRLLSLAPSHLLRMLKPLASNVQDMGPPARWSRFTPITSRPRSTRAQYTIMTVCTPLSTRKKCTEKATRSLCHL
jgi:hypothetical protein